MDFLKIYSTDLLSRVIIFEDDSRLHMVVPILITLSMQISWHYFIGMILMLSCDATHLIELPKAKSQSGNYIGNTWTSGNLPMAGSCARSEFSNWRTFCCYPSRNYIHIPIYTVLQKDSYPSLCMKSNVHLHGLRKKRERVMLPPNWK